MSINDHNLPFLMTINVSLLLAQLPFDCWWNKSVYPRFFKVVVVVDDIWAPNLCDIVRIMKNDQNWAVLTIYSWCCFNQGVFPCVNDQNLPLPIATLVDRRLQCLDVCNMCMFAWICRNILKTHHNVSVMIIPSQIYKLLPPSCQTLECFLEHDS